MRGLAIVAVVFAMACGGGAVARPAAPAPAPSSTAAASAVQDPQQHGFGFVLLRDAILPDAAAVVRAHATLAPDGPPLEIEPGDARDLIAFRQDGALVTVGLLPLAIPDGEAEAHAEFSLKAIVDGWTPPPHRAHLVVMTMGAGATPLARTRNTHRVLAAVATAVGDAAVGIYIGNGGVTHEPASYAALVQETPDAIVAWSGVSIARDADRLSVLSLGMGQLGLPDILLTARTTPPGEALGTLYDLMLYVAKRGERLPAGDTVGSTGAERIPVRYGPSPLDPAVEVMMVDYP